MSKITLTHVADLTQTVTAANTINNDMDIIQNAMDNTLSRDGTSPNQMGAALDMNSNQILNLPSPATANSPVRLQDLNTFSGGGTIATVPAGGAAHAILEKTTSADYVMDWTLTPQLTSLNLSDLTASSAVQTDASKNLVSVTNTGSGDNVLATSPTLTTPNIGAATATTVNKVTITAPATAATLTIPNNVTMTGPAASGTVMTLGNTESVTGVKTFNSGSLILAGATSGTSTLNSNATAGSTTMTLPTGTDTLVALAVAGTLTNKTINASNNTITLRTPTVQKFTSGTSLTYTTPNSCSFAIVKFVGAGGGGSGSGTGTTGGTGGNGGSTIFNGITCSGGTGATASLAGTGGTVSGGSPVASWAGGPGGNVQTGVAGTFLNGGFGAGTVLFGGGTQVAAITSTGAGGGGGFFNGAGNTGGGGGSGASAIAIVAGGGATYTYTVGAAGGAGTAGTSGSAGTAGSTGYIEALEF